MAAVVVVSGHFGGSQEELISLLGGGLWKTKSQMLRKHQFSGPAIDLHVHGARRAIQLADFQDDELKANWPFPAPKTLYSGRLLRESRLILSTFWRLPTMRTSNWTTPTASNVQPNLIEVLIRKISLGAGQLNKPRKSMNLRTIKQDRHTTTWLTGWPGWLAEQTS